MQLFPGNPVVFDGKTAKRQKGICAMRRRLLKQLSAALDGVLAVYRAERKAIQDSDPHFDRFEARVGKQTRAAMARRDAYWAHVKEHGC